MAELLSIPITDPDLTFYDLHRDTILSIAYNKGVQVLIFAEELRRLCKIHKYNFPGLFAQAWHETNGFTSDLWKHRRNPAGLKNTSGKAFQSFVNGVDAARAFVIHMTAYVMPENWKVTFNYRFMDSRFSVAMLANRGRKFHTMDDLAGFWAEDLMYGRKVLKTYKGLFGAI